MASILKEVSGHFNDGNEVESMALVETAIETLSTNNEYVSEVIETFDIDDETKTVLQIGNVKSLLQDIKSLDRQAEKFDIPMKVRDISWDKFLKEEVAIFTLYNIESKEIVKKLRKNYLTVETRYSAKHDVTEYYHFSKFANFLRDIKQDKLISIIQDELHNNYNLDVNCSARIIKPIDSEKYLLRAVTSDKNYKNYGINFSVLVALLAVNQFVENTHEQVFIDDYTIDDSKVYLSFQLAKTRKLNNNVSLSFNLILENDEIKESSVSFNAAFKLIYKSDDKSSYLYVRPNKFKVPNTDRYTTDMLTYTHSMNVETVYHKIQHLPTYMKTYFEQVAEDAEKIASIKTPKNVKEFLIQKINGARKDEFQKFKKDVIKKITLMEVNSIFDLFESLRQVEELFEDDINSKNYWRTKLYEVLLERR